MISEKFTNALHSRIEALEEENRKLQRALEVYEKERQRFRHAKPEMTGDFFLAGGHGQRDQNLLPEYVEICPAYGAGWVQLYQKMNRTISYEGS